MNYFRLGHPDRRADGSLTWPAGFLNLLVAFGLGDQTVEPGAVITLSPPAGMGLPPDSPYLTRVMAVRRTGRGAVDPNSPSDIRALADGETAFIDWHGRGVALVRRGLAVQVDA
jgi:hypothetical protein